MNTHKRYPPEHKELAVKNDNVFCSECGEELDLFGIDGKIDRNKIIERHRNCRKKGKFKGDVCSMMFISGDIELPPLSDEVE
jgi:ribosomal protein S27AE